MKIPLLMALLGAGLAAASAAESKPPIFESKPGDVKVGRMSTVRLVATGRVTDKDKPDGLRLMFLVTRLPGIKGSPTLKETRDFLLDGASYQAKTEAELGKKFEPITELKTAEWYFAMRSRLAAATNLTSAEIAGGHILTLAIGGAALPADGLAELTLQVGFGKGVEPFTFVVQIPSK